jgi:hypothetical protein
MYSLTGAERNHLTDPHLHAVPDWRWPIPEGQCNEKHVRRHRNKGDPREVFVAG